VNIRSDLSIDVRTYGTPQQQQQQQQHEYNRERQRKRRDTIHDHNDHAAEDDDDAASELESRISESAHRGIEFKLHTPTERW